MEPCDLHTESESLGLMTELMTAIRFLCPNDHTNISVTARSLQGVLTAPV